jgi:hypothetical protein
VSVDATWSLSARSAGLASRGVHSRLGSIFTLLYLVRILRVGLVLLDGIFAFVTGVISNDDFRILRVGLTV